MATLSLPNPNSSQRIVWIDLVRVMAAFAVVVNHTGSFFGYQPVPVTLFFSTFVFGDVAVFFLLSGFCLKADHTWLKARRLLVSYLLWIAIGLTNAFLTNRGAALESMSSLHGWLKILGIRLSSPMPLFSGVLWFLRNLVLFYCLFPLWNRLHNRFKLAVLGLLWTTCFLLSNFQGETQNYFCSWDFVSGLCFFFTGAYLSSLRPIAGWTNLLQKYRYLSVIPLLLTAGLLYSLLSGYNLNLLSGMLIRVIDVLNYIAVAVLMTAYVPRLAFSLASLAYCMMAVYVLHPYGIGIAESIFSKDASPNCVYLVFALVVVFCFCVFKIVERLASPGLLSLLFQTKGTQARRRQKGVQQDVPSRTLEEKGLES